MMAQSMTGVAVLVQEFGLRRILGGLGLSVLSATLLVLIWQSFGNLWWLSIVAFVPMYVAQYRVLPRQWSGVPVALAFAGYYLAVGLVGASVVPVWMIAVITGVAAVVGFVVGTPLRPFAERTGYRWFVVQFGLIWVAIDLLLQHNELVGPYPWIAYRISGVPELIQPVSIISTPALSLLIHVINAAIALAVLALIDRRWPPQRVNTAVPRRVVTWSVSLTAAVTALWVASSLVIFAKVTEQMGPSVRVAAIQPGLENATPGTLISAGTITPGRSEAQRRQDQIQELSETTRAAAAQGARVVVWPEEALDYDPRKTLTDWIPALVRETGVYLAMGFTPDATDGAAPNAALMWSPAGRVVSEYFKTARVLAEGEAFTPGSVYPTVKTSVGVLGTIICFDMEFPDGPSRREALNGAQMILAPSIDFASITDVRVGSTTFRAVENRVAMVKADVAWDSVIVAPNGRVISSTALDAERGGRALLVADVPLGPLGAPFTRYGGAPFQWLVYAATALMASAMVTSWWRRRTLAPAPG